MAGTQREDESGQQMIRVAIVEDQRDVRQGLSALLGGTAGFEVSAAYRSMEEALRS